MFGKEKEVTTTALLVTALKDRDVTRRAEAVDLLGLLSQSPDKGLKKEVSRVLGIALKDRDAGLRLQVVEKLGAMESEFANKYLLGALKDPTPSCGKKSFPSSAIENARWRRPSQLKIERRRDRSVPYFS